MDDAAIFNIVVGAILLIVLAALVYVIWYIAPWMSWLFRYALYFLRSANYLRHDEIALSRGTAICLFASGSGFIISAPLAFDLLTYNYCHPSHPGYYRPPYWGGGSIPARAAYCAMPGDTMVSEATLFLLALILSGVVAAVIWTIVPFVTRAIRAAIRFLREGTALQKGLARFWIVSSAAWVVHSIWWIAEHCYPANGYSPSWLSTIIKLAGVPYFLTCTSGTFRVERVNWQSSDLLGYVVTMPIGLLLLTFGAYWVIKGFSSKP